MVLEEQVLRVLREHGEPMSPITLFDICMKNKWVASHKEIRQEMWHMQSQRLIAFTPEWKIFIV